MVEKFEETIVVQYFLKNSGRTYPGLEYVRASMQLTTRLGVEHALTYSDTF